MKIRSIRTQAGPNVYSRHPVLVTKLDLEDLAGKESYDVPGFNDRLLTLLPGLHEHHCALGRPGGFIERLRGGTYFGHTVEHVALELSTLAGMEATRGKTVADDEPGCYLVVVAYRSEAGMRSLVESAVALVEALVAGRDFDVQGALDAAKHAAAEHDLGPSTRAIVEAAAARNIPWRRVNDDSLVRLGYGRHMRFIQATATDRTQLIGVDIAGDKALTKQVLAAAALPVPAGRTVDTREDAMACLDALVAPLVVKPLDGNQGKGVSLNLTTREQVAEAFDIAQRISRRVLVEEMYRGNDYRVVMVDGRMVAAAQRVPAHVWGDGTHTIRELIELTNRDPRRGDDHEKPMTKITADPIVLAILKRNGRALDDVPAEGQMIVLRDSANLSRGGSARDMTDDVHASVRRVCERAARAVALDVCGIDLVLPDIRAPLGRTGGIVEVNASPGIRMHHHPSEGKPRDVGGAIVNMLFPPGTPARIPICSITGTNGKTTVTRMIGHVLLAQGLNVGMTTSAGIWIGGEAVARGDMTGPWSAGVVLDDRSVEAAVLETARGGIVRFGLGYDWSDVGVMTNVQADHLGQDGIEDLEGILDIKSLVAERVREGGTLVLNADDPMIASVPDLKRVRRISRQVAYYSLNPDNPRLVAHLAAGGTAFVADGNRLEMHSGRRRTILADAATAPCTLRGTAVFQVGNVLAALAACHALGVDPFAACAALATFSMDRDSEGRLNLFAVNGGHVLVDYAHNPAALDAIGGMLAKWRVCDITAIVTAPGDRRDSLLQEFARRAACNFDRLVIREDLDRRGRAPGEIAAILSDVVRTEYPQVEMRIVLDELEALASSVAGLKRGELVVAFCDRTTAVLEWLAANGATPVTDIGELLPEPATPPESQVLAA